MAASKQTQKLLPSEAAEHLVIGRLLPLGLLAGQIPRGISQVAPSAVHEKSD